MLALLLSSSLKADQLDLFVMAGQSNMLGYAGNAAFYPVDPQLDQQIGFFWVAPGLSDSSGRWTHMQAQGGRFPRGHFGPEVTFARELLKTGVKPYIFKYSVSTTSLEKDWLGPGQGGLYDDMLTQLGKAIAAQEKAGNRVKLKALIWVQGETDAQTRRMAKAYYPRLQMLITDFRQNVAKNPSLPVLLGVDEQHPDVRKQPIIVESQKRLAAVEVCVAATSMLSLAKADDTHLTPAGLEAHGRRLHAAYQHLSKTCG